MIEIKQPNSWSCLPAAFAMVMDLDFGTVISDLGHDGCTIIFPELTGRIRHTGFHIQELIWVAWQRGWTTTHFQILPQMAHGTHHRSVLEYSDAHRRLNSLMAQTSGVLTGLNDRDQDHAVAWDAKSGILIDPARKAGDFRVESFWALRHNQ